MLQGSGLQVLLQREMRRVRQLQQVGSLGFYKPLNGRGPLEREGRASVFRKETP